MNEETVQFSEFGSDFVTRRQGERARQMLEQALKSYPANDRVCISLAGIGTMTPSFADECFGKLILSLGAPRFKARIVLVDVDDTTKALLNAVLSKRARESAAANETASKR